jgi:hypothetical protein
VLHTNDNNRNKYSTDPSTSISNALNEIPVVKTERIEIKEAAYMSPITSEENSDDEPETKDKLLELLKSDNLEMLEDYVNTQFANLGQDEIIEKLMALDENSRNKLLNLVVEYQQRVGAVQNEEENQNLRSVNQEEEFNDFTDKDIKDENVISDELMDVEQAQTIQNQDDNMDIKMPISSKINNLKLDYRVNENLSYLGFSGLNTDILKGEILKSQNQSQQNQNIINEEQLKIMNINKNIMNMPNNINMNINYPHMMNMNQAYILNQVRPMMIHPNYLIQGNYNYDNSGMNSQMNVQMNPQINSQMNAQINSQMNAQINSQMNAQINSQMNPQLNSQMNPQLNSQNISSNLVNANQMPYPFPQRKNTKFNK